MSATCPSLEYTFLLSKDNRTWHGYSMTNKYSKCAVQRRNAIDPSVGHCHCAPLFSVKAQAASHQSCMTLADRNALYNPGV